MKVFKNKFSQVVEKSFDFILGLFGCVAATKFRDLTEYSDCVQNGAQSLSDFISANVLSPWLMKV